MRITGILPGEIDVPRAVHIYRVTMPLNAIRKHTDHSISWISSRGSQDLNKRQLDYLLSSDIITLGRPISNDADDVMKFYKMLKSKGAKVVYETDDDLTNLYRDTSDGTGGTCIPYLYLTDASTVSTQPLAERIGIYTSNPIYVCPNCIDPDFFQKAVRDYKREYTGTINIMLVGTKTHGEDWNLAAQAAKRIIEEYPNVRLLVGGFHPDYIEQTERVELIDFKPYYAYPTTLAEADIVIAAIDPDDGFNRCKSAVKAMEAWAARRTLENGTAGGAAVIATDSVVYRGTVEHEKNGLLVEHSEEGYFDALRRLLDDDELRMRIQKRGYRDARTKHDINRGYRKWLSAYTRIARS